MIVAFLILHYKNYKETIECIDSIYKNIDGKYEVVVVDNGSNDNSNLIIKERYKKDNFHIITSNENVGFSKGNNIGFQYIKNNLKCDFIFMINSDTELNDSKTLSKIISLYKQTNFDICGPNILLLNGELSNPNISPIKNIYSIKKEIKKNRRKIIINRMGLEIINVVIQRIRTKLINKEVDRTKQIICTGQIQLHGSALIFSKKYINKYDGLFDGTFLYFEEVALRYIAIRDQLTVIYDPSISIIHKESKSTKMIYSGITKRHRFYYENVLYSAQKVYEMIEKDKSTLWK